MCNPRCISHVDYWCTFSGVFHVNCFTWINGVPIHVDIRWISCEECHPFLVSHVFRVYFSHGLLVYLSTCIFGGYQVKFEPFFMCNPRCISHMDWIPVHVDIRWISCEDCHLILFHLFSTCIFHMDLIGVPIHVYIWWIACNG